MRGGESPSVECEVDRLPERRLPAPGERGAIRPRIEREPVCGEPRGEPKQSTSAPVHAVPLLQAVNDRVRVREHRCEVVSILLGGPESLVEVAVDPPEDVVGIGASPTVVAWVRTSCRWPSSSTVSAAPVRVRPRASRIKTPTISARANRPFTQLGVVQARRFAAMLSEANSLLPLGP